MAQRIKLDIEAIEKYYRIEEDGAIWSYKHKRYVRQTLNMPGYAYVSLYPVRRMTSVHKIVAQKYLGICPPDHEVHHIDNNKLNNHWSNLQYITHSENIAKSFSDHGRRHPPGNCHPHSVATKLLMSQAKMKPVYCSDGRSWGSVTECAADIEKSRTSIWLFIKLEKELKGVGGILSFCSPADEKNKP